MPRGNDSEAAAAELADRFSEGRGNAENLIRANNAARPVELIRASEKALDEELTAEYQEKLDSLKGPNGEAVVSASVRGITSKVLITAYEDENGRIHKDSVLLDDGEQPKKAAKKPARSKAKAADDAAEDSDD